MVLTDFFRRKQGRVQMRQLRQQAKMLMIKKQAVEVDYNLMVKGSRAQGKKMITDLVKMMLQAFNDECDFCIEHVEFKPIEASRRHIDRTFEQCNRLGAVVGAKISSHYKELKLTELNLAFAYQRKRAIAKGQAYLLEEELTEEREEA